MVSFVTYTGPPLKAKCCPDCTAKIGLSLMTGKLSCSGCDREFQRAELLEQSKPDHDDSD